MRVIGISGGIASGKSAVARRLAQWGAVVLDADQLGHDVLLDPEVREKFRDRWGDAVFHNTGEVNRRAVAARVFGDTEQHVENLRFLEHVSHPRIARLAQQQLDQLRRQATTAVVLDAALLYEAGWNEMCDVVLFVDAPEAQRRARAVQRGWSDDQFTARQAAQESVEKKRERADYVLDNSGDLNYLHDQVDAWWRAHHAPADPQPPTSPLNTSGPSTSHAGNGRQATPAIDEQPLGTEPSHWRPRSTPH